VVVRRRRVLKPSWKKTFPTHRCSASSYRPRTISCRPCSQAREGEGRRREEEEEEEEVEEEEEEEEEDDERRTTTTTTTTMTTRS